MTALEVRTFRYHQILSRELVADAAVDIRSYLTRRIREEVIRRGDTPVGDPCFVWHRVSEFEQQMNVFKGEPTLLTGDWRVIGSIRAITTGESE